MASCADDEIKPSDLNDEGAPRVITVTVLSEAVEHEVATYCAPEANGEKLNSHYCLDEEGAYLPASKVTDAAPLNPQLRIIFNEVLIPEYIEELVPVDCQSDVALDQCREIELIYRGTLVNTQPVDIVCGGEPVAYDGYYQITGSHLTDPGGPAIIVTPDFIATSTQDCTVTVKEDLYDKDLQKVTERGPFEFGIAALSLLGTEPANMDEGVDPCTAPALVFNALVDAAAVEAGAVTLEGPDGPIPVTLTSRGDAIEVRPEGAPEAQPLLPDTAYTLQVTAGATFADILGGSSAVPEALTVTFETGALPEGGCEM